MSCAKSATTCQIGVATIATDACDDFVNRTTARASSPSPSKDFSVAADGVPRGTALDSLATYAPRTRPPFQLNGQMRLPCIEDLAEKTARARLVGGRGRSGFTLGYGSSASSGKRGLESSGCFTAGAVASKSTKIIRALASHPVAGMGKSVPHVLKAGRSQLTAVSQSNAPSTRYTSRVRARGETAFR